MFRKISPVILLLFFLIIPATVFCGTKDQIKHLISITGNKEIGSFGYLGGIFYDENKKRLYLTDTTHGRILAFDDKFKYLSEFTGGDALVFPASIVRDSRGKFFVTEPTKGQVLEIDMAEKSIKPIDFSPVAGTNPVYPWRMTVDSADNLYVVDKANQRILVFDDGLKFKRQITVKGGDGLADVKVDSAGRIYTLCAIDGLVRVYDREGSLVFKFGKRGDGKGEFDFPVSLAIDRQGRIYVVDQHKNQILVFNNKGRFLFSFSRLGWREGRLHMPSFVYVNNSRQIFVIDRENSRVSVFE